jgi:acyl-CoA reductase-like NAD-dependent aldehyde dehydrogenase
MRLFIATMDAFLVEFDNEGRIRLEKDGWSAPSVQERRAIIHAAKDELESLKELLDVLESKS